MGLRLHIGCGDDIKPGYINIDEYSPKANLQVPLQNISYPENSVERIEGYMILEHLSPQMLWLLFKCLPDVRT